MRLVEDGDVGRVEDVVGGGEHNLVITNQLWNQAALSSSGTPAS